MNATEVDLIKKTFGAHYSANLVKELTALKIYNKSGKPFTQRGLRKIVSGLDENLPVTLEILKICVKEIKNQKRLAAEREAIIKKEM